MSFKLRFRMITLRTFAATSLVMSGCGQTGSDQLASSNSVTNDFVQKESLYVASGACYAGGVATLAGSGTIAAFDPATGNLRRVIIDYGTYSPGDLPVAISNYDTTRLLVTIENASGRRIDLVNKDGSGAMTFLTNSSALNGVLRATKLLADGSFLVNKSTAIEKFNSSRARILQGANPYVNAPASSCAATSTLISGLESLANGKILYTHSALTPNNKLVLISSAGYSATTDCLATQAAPTLLAMPTAVLVHSSGKILVPYASTTNSSNLIYSYALNSTTNVFSAATQAYSDAAVVNGPSALAEDVLSTDVFVANGNSTFNTIERFAFDPTAGVLTHLSGRVGPNIYTRCVAAMKMLAE